jgi:hypothetical protein
MKTIIYALLVKIVMIEATKGRIMLKGYCTNTTVIKCYAIIVTN